MKYSLLCTVICFMLSCQIVDGGIMVNINTGNPLPILFPNAKPPVLKITNSDKKKFKVSVSLVIKDINGRIVSRNNHKIMISEVGNVTLPLYKPELLGWYGVDITIRSNSKVLYQKGLNYVYMRPCLVQSRVPDDFIFGVSGHMWTYPANEQKILAQALAWCGAQVFRDNAAWFNIQPQVDMWDFSRLDQTIALLKPYKIDVAPILGIGAQWTKNMNYKCLTGEKGWNSRPPKLNLWQKYVHGFMEHYKGKIRYIEPSNEPELCVDYSPEEFLKMTKIVYDEAKKADVNMQVLSAGFAGPDIGAERQTTSDFVLQAMKKGKLYYDILAFHVHGNFEWYIQQLKKIMHYRKLTGDDKPWWPNETALSSLDQKVQAETLYKKLLLTWGLGGMGYTWYNLRDKGDNPNNMEHHYGLLKNDLSPKAVYVTYSMLAGYLRKAKLLEDHSSKSVYSFLFKCANGDYLIPCWTLSGKHFIMISGIQNRAALVDIWGNETPVRPRNAVYILNAEQSPKALRIFAQSLPPMLHGEFMKLPENYFISKGCKKRVNIELSNPTRSNIPIIIKWKFAQNLKITPSVVEYDLKPNESNNFVFELNADNNFETSDVNMFIKFGMLWNGLQSLRINTSIKLSSPGFKQSPDLVIKEKKYLTDLVVNHPETDKLHWRNPKDLSIKIFLAHDNMNLKIRAVVKDDIHVQPLLAGKINKGDSVQIILDIPHQKGFWNILFARSNSGKNAKNILHYPKYFSFRRAMSKIQFKSFRDNARTQTIYDITIPFSAIGLSEQTGREGVRFNVLINDSDGSFHESIMAISPIRHEVANTENFPLLSL